MKTYYLREIDIQRAIISRQKIMIWIQRGFIIALFLFCAFLIWVKA
jgi:hypothetical protein